MKNKIFKTYFVFLTTATLILIVFSLQSFRYETKSIIGNTISDFSIKMLTEKPFHCLTIKMQKNSLLFSLVIIARLKNCIPNDLMI